MPQKPWEDYAPQHGPWEDYATPAPVAAGQRGAPPRTNTGTLSQTTPPSDYGLSSLLPSGRTVAQGAGAAVGGVLGAPAGPLGAIAGGALGGATGESLYQDIQRLRGKTDTGTSGEAAKQIGLGAVGGGIQEALGEALPKAGSAVASRLYRIALKPSTTLTNEEAGAVANTLLKRRIPISESGTRKLGSLIDELGTKVENTIATKPGAEVNPSAVATRVDPTIQGYAYKDLQKDLGAAEGEKARFLTEHSTPVQYSPFPPPHQPSLSFPVEPQSYAREIPIPANRAQAMKKAIYQELSPNDFGTVATGYKEARKQEARGLKEELENLFPSIKGLNAEQGELLEAQPELTRAVNRTENRDVLGIGAPIMAGATTALTGKPSLAAALALAKNAGSRTAILADILSHPVMGVTPAALPRFGVVPSSRLFAGSANQ